MACKPISYTLELAEKNGEPCLRETALYALTPDAIEKIAKAEVSELTAQYGTIIGDERARGLRIEDLLKATLALAKDHVRRLEEHSASCIDDKTDTPL